jgi:hypothetical protein
MNTRRSLLTTTALLPVALLPIGACTALQSVLGMTPAQWATDLSLAAGWMPSVVSALAALGVPAATLTQITTWANTVKTDAAAVATATATVVVGTSSATYVQEAMQTLMAIATVVMPLFPVTAPLLPIVEAFLALVPELAAALGLTSAPFAVKATMTIDAARAVLSQPH